MLNNQILLISFWCSLGETNPIGCVEHRCCWSLPYFTESPPGLLLAGDARLALRVLLVLLAGSRRQVSASQGPLYGLVAPALDPLLTASRHVPTWIAEVRRTIQFTGLPSFSREFIHFTVLRMQNLQLTFIACDCSSPKTKQQNDSRTTKKKMPHGNRLVFGPRCLTLCT